MNLVILLKRLTVSHIYICLTVLLKKGYMEELLVYCGICIKKSTLVFKHLMVVLASLSDATREQDRDVCFICLCFVSIGWNLL